LAPFYFGGWLWAALAGVFGGRMLFEWVRMSDPSPAVPAYLTPILGLLAGIIYTVQSNFGYAVLCIFVTAIAVAGIQVVRKGDVRSSRIVWAVLGVVYIILPTLLMVGLRGNEIGFDTVGFQRLLFVMACVIGADVGAYFGGSTIGGPKLAPKLSPIKMWSRFLSGHVLDIILGGFFGTRV